MAEKRCISKVISISKKFNIKLDDHFSRLLYLMLIPHSDDFGRLSGDPFDIKALILPMMEGVTTESVENSLAKLHNVELIKWYEIAGEKYIQIINFDDHQQGLHKRTRSKFPEPPEHSGKFPEIPPEGREGKGREEKGTEEKGREGTEGSEPPAPPPDLESIKSRLHNLVNEAKIANYNLHDLDVLFSYIGTVDVEVIEAAIKKSYEKESLRYTIRTLGGMIKDGIRSKGDLLPKMTQGSQGKSGNGHTKSGKPELPVVSNTSSQTVSPEEREKMRALARQLKQGGSHAEAHDKGAGAAV